MRSVALCIFYCPFIKPRRRWHVERDYMAFLCIRLYEYVCVCNEEKGKNNCCSELFSPHPATAPPSTLDGTVVLFTCFSDLFRVDSSSKHRPLIVVFSSPVVVAGPRLITLYLVCPGVRASTVSVIQCFKWKLKLFFAWVRSRSIIGYLGRPISIGNIAFKNNVVFRLRLLRVQSFSDLSQPTTRVLAAFQVSSVIEHKHTLIQVVIILRL